MLTSAQIRAARAMLRWDQSQLAKSADVSTETIKRIERLDGSLASTKAGTLHAIEAALRSAGVEFTNGGQPGVKMVGEASKTIAVEELNSSNDE